jgi:tetratricopeptide (TPR) repeat protein
MSEVVEVEDSFSGERFALKWLTRNGRARKRFDREYEAMIRLNHPSVVRVYHYGLQDQRPWMTMEMVDGEPVQRFAKMLGRPGTKSRTQDLLVVARQMALALDHVHRRGLIHRDLKSANVLVLPDGRVKLIDFGTAKVENPMEEITGSGEFVGTYAYASPEQLRGQRLTLRSDLYNLGVLYYRMFTGKLPFYGDGIYDIAKQHVESVPTPPIERVPELPEELNALILQMLEKNPDRRPRSAQVVAEAFDRMAGRPTGAASMVNLNLPYRRMVGRDQQLVRAERFIEAHVPGSMLIATGNRGCGRRSFYQALRESTRTSKTTFFSAIFRREGAPLHTLVGLCLRIGQTLDDDTPELRAAMRALEVEQDWDADRVISVSQVLFKRAGIEKSVVFLRSLHFADRAAWRVIWSWQDQLASLAIPWTFVGDGLDWLGTRAALPKKVSMKAHMMRLPPLDILRLGSYIGSLLNRRPPPVWITQQIHEATGGWPLHTEHRLRDWVNEGVLKVDGKDPNRLRWDQISRDDLQPVAGYKAAIEQGLDFLDRDELDVLVGVALAEGVLPIADLAATVKLEEVQLMECLRRLHRSHWIHMERTTVSCTNAQIARQVIGRVSEAQVEAIQEWHWERGNLRPELRLRWLLKEGRCEEAVVYAADWVEKRYEAESPITALGLVEAVFPALAELEITNVQARDRLWLAYVRCVLAVRPSDSTARHLYNALRETIGEDKRLQADYVGAVLVGVIGHYPMFREHLERAWAKHFGGRPSPTLLLIGMSLAWVEEQFGDLEKANEWYVRLQEVVARLGRKSARSLVLKGRARLAYTAGRLDEAARIAEKGMGTLEGIQGVSARAEVLPVYVDCLRLQGRFSEAVIHLAEALALARATEMPKLVVPLLLAAARCEIDLYRLGRAQEYVDELMVSLRPGEHLYLRLEATLLWGRILVASGEYHHAIGILNDTQERAQAAGLSVIACVAAALSGQATCSLGRAAEGDAQMREATEQLSALGRHGGALECALIRARARGGTVDPAVLFESVREQIEQQVAVVPRLEWLIATRRFKGKSPEIDDAIDASIAQIVRASSGMERSALRVHPWARQARLREQEEAEGG